MFADVTIEFPFEEGGKPKPVVLIGVNGAGKSSIIRALVSILDYNFSLAFDYPYSEELKIKSDDIKSGQPRLFIECFFVIGEEMIFIEVVKSLDKEVSILIGGRHSINSIDLIKVNQPVCIHYPANRIASQSQRTENRGRPNIWSEGFNAKLTNFETFLTWFEELENLENEKKLEQKDFDYKEKDLEAVRSAIISFWRSLPDADFKNLRVRRTHKTGNGKIFQSNIESNLIIDKGAETFSISNLSDGEKMLLLVVCDIARRLAIADPEAESPLLGKGIVLIDEIDLHLHPSWQKSVIQGLQTTFPNIQFIVTTHSPLIINHVPQESVLVLKDGDCFPMSSHPFNSYGADIEDIYTIVQGVESLLPEEIGRKLQTFFRLIDEDKMEEAKSLRKDLEKLIDAHHPELLKGQTLMDYKALSR